MGLGLVAALIVGAGGTAAYAGLSGSVPAAQAQDRLVVRGGVIRLGPSVYLHTNNAHAAIGITKLQIVNKCHLRLQFDRTRNERIVAAIAEEDERMAQLGVQAGISGGVHDAEVLLFRKGKRICANDRIFGTRSNLWISLTYLASSAPAPAPTPTASPSTPPA